MPKILPYLQIYDYSILLILLLATALRFYHLDQQSLWSDEGNSVALTHASFAQIAARTAFDIHPPFYYWLLKGWVSFWGGTEFALRALSASLGVLLIALIIRLGRDVAADSVGLAAGFVAALTPFQVYYAQETRMYMLLTLLAAASVWLALRCWQTGPPHRGVWLGYALVVALGLYTQYAFPLMLAVINGTALIVLWQRKSRLLAWLGWQAIPLLLYLPWLPIAFRQITTWPSLIEVAAPAHVAQTLMQILSLGVSASVVPYIWVLILWGLTGFGLFAAWRWSLQVQRSWAWLLLGGWLILPAGMTALLFRPAYLKIFLIASPAWCLLLGLGIVHLGRWGRYIPLLTTMLVAIPAASSLNATYHDSAFQRDNYRAIATFIEAVAAPTTR